MLARPIPSTEVSMRMCETAPRAIDVARMSDLAPCCTDDATPAPRQALGRVEVDDRAVPTIADGALVDVTGGGLCVDAIATCLASPAYGIGGYVLGVVARRARRMRQRWGWRRGWRWGWRWSRQRFKVKDRGRG